MHLFHSLGHVFGGSLLIAGTTIGVGMLALPIATGEGGFLPAITIYFICWLFMLCTGLLMLEVCLWMPKDSNLITMTRRLLGPLGKDVCWVVYLFLFVTVMIAHVAGGGEVLSEITNGKLPEWLSMIIYVIFFSPVIYLGTKWVDRLNILFILGVAISYFLFIAVSYDHVDISMLKRSDWSKAWLAIIFGTSIPLVVYLIWEVLILGIIPADGPHGLIEAAKAGQNAVMPLKQLIGTPILFAIGKSFAFFTLTTSYIALSLAYLDFLADGLKMQKTGLKKVLLCLLVLVPPTIIALTYPHIFLTALRYAGGFSCAILFGLFPPLMAWIGRYKMKYDRTTQQLPGGKPFLTILMLFIFVELGIEVYQEISNLL